MVRMVMLSPPGAGKGTHGGFVQKAEPGSRRCDQQWSRCGRNGAGLRREHAPIEQAQIRGERGQLALAALDHRQRLWIVEAPQRANVLAGTIQYSIETIEPLNPR